MKQTLQNTIDQKIQNVEKTKDAFSILVTVCRISVVEGKYELRKTKHMGEVARDTSPPSLYFFFPVYFCSIFFFFFFRDCASSQPRLSNHISPR